MKNINDIRPSQLYLNAAKIAKIRDLYEPITIEKIPPIPIKKLNNELIFVDGHTRAYIAFKKGIFNIPVYHYPDNDLNWNFYQIYVDWCKAERIMTIQDLENRIVKNTEYRRLWINRCENLKKEYVIQKK